MKGSHCRRAPWLYSAFVPTFHSLISNYYLQLQLSTEHVRPSWDNREHWAIWEILSVPRLFSSLSRRVLQEKPGLLGVHQVAHELLNSQPFSFSHLSVSFNNTMCNLLITTCFNLQLTWLRVSRRTDSLSTSSSMSLYYIQCVLGLCHYISSKCMYFQTRC